MVGRHDLLQLTQVTRKRATRQKQRVVTIEEKGAIRKMHNVQRMTPRGTRKEEKREEHENERQN